MGAIGGWINEVLGKGRLGFMGKIIAHIYSSSVGKDKGNLFILTALAKDLS